MLVLSVEAHEVIHNSEPVSESVVHGYKMLPGHETAVVPFAPHGRFDGERRRLEEAKVASREAVSIDIGHVLVLKLIGHGDAVNHVKVASSVIAVPVWQRRVAH